VPLASSKNCFTSSPEVVTKRLTIDSFEPSLSWTMTPRLVVQGGTTIQILDGFQSNPYRAVGVRLKAVEDLDRRPPLDHQPRGHRPGERRLEAVDGQALGDDLGGGGEAVLRRRQRD